MCLSDRQVSFLSCICDFRRLQRHNFIYELMYIYVKYNAESLEVLNHAKCMSENQIIIHSSRGASCSRRHVDAVWPSTWCIRMFVLCEFDYFFKYSAGPHSLNDENTRACYLSLLGRVPTTSLDTVPMWDMHSSCKHAFKIPRGSSSRAVARRIFRERSTKTQL